VCPGIALVAPPSLFQQVPDDSLDRAAGNGKANTPGLGIDRGVDTNHFALQVQ